MTSVYDGDGNRISKTVGGTTTSYTCDENRSFPVVLTDGTLTYVCGLGLAYAVDGSNNVQVFHTDGLGSDRALADGSGAVTQTFQTDEFGIPTLTQGTNTEPFRYTGQQRDAETSFYDLRARYYWPTLGRFVSRDGPPGALALLLSRNQYAYVQNNPITLPDPSGECITIFCPPEMHVSGEKGELERAVGQPGNPALRQATEGSYPSKSPSPAAGGYGSVTAGTKVYRL